MKKKYIVGYPRIIWSLYLPDRNIPPGARQRSIGDHDIYRVIGNVQELVALAYAYLFSLVPSPGIREQD